MNKVTSWLQNLACKLIQRDSKQRLFDMKAQYLNQCVIHSTEMGVSEQPYCAEQITVSLTTYGKRLYDVYLTIESIMQGTMKPNRIVLWLEDALTDTPLPRTLLMQQQRGLEIYYTKDIRSYKKLIPALTKYPDDVIITIDDDVIYDIDVVENLVQAYIRQPHAIYASRVRTIQLDGHNQPAPYKKWKRAETGQLSPRNFFTGVGGVLYPPHCFDSEVFDENVFMQLCPSGDDIWFYAMGLKNDYYVSKVFTHNPLGENYTINLRVQDMALMRVNTGGRLSRNDVQLRAVLKHYNLTELLTQ